MPCSRSSASRERDESAFICVNLRISGSDQSTDVFHGLAAVAELDSILTYQYGNNPALLAAWKSVRHVQRNPVREAEEPAAPGETLALNVESPLTAGVGSATTVALNGGESTLGGVEPRVNGTNGAAGLVPPTHKSGACARLRGCAAFDLHHWTAEAFFFDVEERLRSQTHVFVENFIHVWGQCFSTEGGPKWCPWQQANPVPCERSGYAPWNLMGTCRHERIASRLWHDVNPPEEYAELAQSWGLPYPVEAFVDPNAGQGVGEAPLA